LGMTRGERSLDSLRSLGMTVCCSLGMTRGKDPSASLGMTRGKDPSASLGMTRGKDPSTRYARSG
ncbi:MAG: hypothetical protein WBD04_03975, partial [Candidatus Omnitrophota bacterium]